MESISSITLDALDPASSGTYFASLDGKENRLLLKGDRPNATYGSGYLLYLLDKTLMAQAFDPERGQLKGDAHPVAERIASDSDGNGFFDVSENGVLIYQAGDSLREKRITWFDRAGKELSAGERGSYDSLRLSPDGAKLAYKAGDPTLISGWTNWRAVSTFASPTILGLATAIRPGRPTEAGFCSTGTRAFTR